MHEILLTKKKLESTKMKKLLCLLLALTLAAPQTFAECSKPVITLTEGQVAPCKGYLFSPTKEQEVRILTEDYSLLQEKLELKDKQIELLRKDVNSVEFIIKKEQEKSELWRNAAELSTTQLVKMQESKGSRDILMILAGVLITVGAGYAVGQASK